MIKESSARNNITSNLVTPATSSYLQLPTHILEYTEKERETKVHIVYTIHTTR